MRRWHLTYLERRHIKTLRLRGCSQTAIARIMRITRNTVALALRRMGLPTRQQVDEGKVLALLRRNMDRRTVAQKLGVSLRAVKRIAKAHHIRRKIVNDSFRGKRKQVESLIRSGLYCGREIADTLRVPYRRVLKLAHEFYGDGKFIGGSPTAMKPPFESYEPQVRRLLEKNVTTQHERDAALIYIIKTVASAGFGGRLPENQAELSRLVGAAIGFSVLIFKREHPEVYLVAADQERLVDYFMPRFLETVDTLRTAQTGWTN
jgi:predicted transcriptional regulator